MVRSTPGRSARSRWPTRMPNVIYVGTGSACPRGNVSNGDGVYKSTDAGKTWTAHRPRPRRGSSVVSASTRRTPISSMSPCSATSSVPIRSAACSERRTAAPRGSTCSRSREHGRRGPRHGREESRCADRRDVGGATSALVDRLRQHGRRRSSVRPTAASKWTRLSNGLPKGVMTGTDRRDGVGRQSQAHVRADRGGRRSGRRLPLGRRRRDVDADLRGPQPPAAGVLLHSHLRRSGRARDGLRAEHGRLQVHRRRQDVPERRHPDARRPSRSLDQPDQQQGDRQRQRRRRHRVARRAHMVGPRTRSRRRRSTVSTVDNRWPYYVYGAQQDNSTIAVPSSGPGRNLRGRRRRERAHRRRSAQLQHHLRGELRRIDHAHGPVQRRDREHSRLRRLANRAARGRHEIPLSVECADPRLASTIPTPSTTPRSTCTRRPTAVRRGPSSVPI